MFAFWYGTHPPLTSATLMSHCITYCFRPAVLHQTGLGETSLCSKLLCLDFKGKKKNASAPHVLLVIACCHESSRSTGRNISRSLWCRAKCRASYKLAVWIAHSVWCVHEIGRGWLSATFALKQPLASYPIVLGTSADTDAGCVLLAGFCQTLSTNNLWK